MSRSKRSQAYIDPGLQRMMDEEFPAAPQIATFWEGPRLDEVASKRHGHAVYARVPFVKIQISGEKDFHSLAATREHIEKFPEEWRRFQEHRGGTKTPLVALPTMDIGIARTIAELGLPSVELLAEAPIVDVIAPAEPSIDLGDPQLEGSGPEPDLPEAARVLPRWLEKWQFIARQYLALKHYAETGEKPRVKLSSVA